MFSMYACLCLIFVTLMYHYLKYSHIALLLFLCLYAHVAHYNQFVSWVQLLLPTSFQGLNKA